MKRVNGLVALSGLLVMLAAGGCGARGNLFKVYQVNPPVDDAHDVVVSSLADEGAWIPAELDEIRYLATPAAMTDGRGKLTPIDDPTVYLTWRRLSQAEPEPARTVRLKNEFGVQDWTLGDAAYLLVPSEELIDDLLVGPFMPDLNHYKAYRVTEHGFRPKVVELEDRFGVQRRVTIAAPRYFCVPVQTQYDAWVTGHEDLKTHLAVYEISHANNDQSLTTEDQFGVHELHLGKSVMMAVPSNRVRWGAE